jgi:hypothetical protein
LIYFLQAEPGGPVKIGYTKDLAGRKKHLEAYYHRPLKLLAHWEGTREDEEAIHARFRRHRFGRSEQFRPAPELMEFIGEFATADPDSASAMEPKRIRVGWRVKGRLVRYLKFAASLDEMTIEEKLEQILERELEPLLKSFLAETVTE